LRATRLCGTLPGMAHTVSDQKSIRRDAEINAPDIARQTAQVREDLTLAGPVVEIWNSRLAAGRGQKRLATDGMKVLTFSKS
jgi:hypothetical protein